MTRLVLPKLGFLTHIPSLYFHYRPVLNLLPPGSYDLILPDDPPPALFELVQRLELPYSLISNLLSAHTMYKYLVSDHLFLQDYHMLQNLGSYHIRFFSELGYDRLHLGNNNRFYDLFLCFGRYQQRKLNFCAGAGFFQVGCPQYDAWYEGMNIDLNTLLDSLNCDRYRPVLVWLPTFGDLCSIEAYLPLFERLTDRYNIVVKPHDYTLLEEPERVAMLQSVRQFQAVITEPYDELLLYVAGDYFLADYGNTPFGAVYTDQRLVLLDLPNAYEHPFTGLGSAEITLRNYYPSLDPGDNPDRLIRLIEEDDDWKIGSRHLVLRERLYSSAMLGRSAREVAGILAAVEQFL